MNEKNLSAPEGQLNPETRAEQRARRRWHRYRGKIHRLRSLVFFAALYVLAFIGLLWFARPATSVVEKRELTVFPAFTWQGVWDGSWFSDIDTWYSDTYPLRERLISMDNRLESLYGLRTEQLVSSGEKIADEIPTDEVDLQALVDARDEAAAETTPEPEEEIEGKGDVTVLPESFGAVYIANNCAYDVYYFEQANSAEYCLLVNQLAEACEGLADVYCLLSPVASGIMLSDEVRVSLGGSDMKAAMEWMYTQMDDSVRKVSVYHTLKAHNDEYIFFRTDHHWTALGAYYAYREFCAAKGVEPHELSCFESLQFDNFLGTFYSASNQSYALAANPDTITAYIPMGTNEMTMQVPNGDGTYTEYVWPIVNDVSDYPSSEMYACFAGSDQPYNYVHNPEITDGSSILVVKDSYGNAFIPFLVDHYEHIYWIDYRYYTLYCIYREQEDVSVSALVRQEGIQDVLLLNNITAASGDGSMKYFQRLYQ